jgi:hypothetical protein
MLPHPPLHDHEAYAAPEGGVILNVVDPPDATETGPAGLLVPLGLILAIVTVYVVDASINVAVTVQLAVMEPVVYVLPLSEPSQPVTEAMLYPEFAVTVNEAVLPDCTEIDVGLTVPPVPALAVTV